MDAPWVDVIKFVAGGILTVLIEESIRRYLIRKRGKPNFGGSFSKVEREIKKINKKLGDMSFYPDIILGVSGENLVGGTIVGAWLASDSFQRRPERFRQAFRNRKLSEELRREISINKWNKFLIVDDESQGGDTILKEMNEVQDLIPGADIRVAVIVVREDSWGKLREELWEKQERCVYCYQNVPDKLDVHWPWKT